VIKHILISTKKRKKKLKRISDRSLRNLTKGLKARHKENVFREERKCSTCGGTGKCPSCNGREYIEK
jgi:DnaJ-class molecular chaperone